MQASLDVPFPTLHPSLTRRFYVCMHCLQVGYFDSKLGPAVLASLVLLTNLLIFIAALADFFAS